VEYYLTQLAAMEAMAAMEARVAMAAMVAMEAIVAIAYRTRFKLLGSA
jgi:hypothetical protein